MLNMEEPLTGTEFTKNQLPESPTQGQLQLVNHDLVPD
jgi:hypothetical protein